MGWKDFFKNFIKECWIKYHAKSSSHINPPRDRDRAAPQNFFWKYSTTLVTVIKKKPSVVRRSYFIFLSLNRIWSSLLYFSGQKFPIIHFCILFTPNKHLGHNIYRIRFNLQFSLYKRIIRLELKSTSDMPFHQDLTCKSDKKQAAINYILSYYFSDAGIKGPWAFLHGYLNPR